MKIVSTFTPVMAKYFLCLFSGALLMLGCNYTLNKEMQKFRIETGTTQVHSFRQANDQTETTMLLQSVKNNSSVENGTYDSKINKFILKLVRSVRNVAASNIPKFDITSASIQIQSLLNSLFHENRWKKITLNTHFTKDTYRSYIYALNRILI